MAPAHKHICPCNWAAAARVAPGVPGEGTSALQRAAQKPGARDACLLLPRCPKATPRCWASTGVCLWDAGFLSIFHGKRKMQAAGIAIAHSWAVLAAGMPLAACLLGPTGITLHQLVSSSCFAWVGTRGSPQLPIHLTPCGLVPPTAITPCP